MCVGAVSLSRPSGHFHPTPYHSAPRVTPVVRTTGTHRRVPLTSPVSTTRRVVDSAQFPNNLPRIISFRTPVTEPLLYPVSGTKTGLSGQEDLDGALLFVPRFYTYSEPDEPTPDSVDVPEDGAKWTHTRRRLDTYSTKAVFHYLTFPWKDV